MSKHAVAFDDTDPYAKSRAYTPPTTPAASEGPYKVEMCHESSRHIVRDPDGVAVFASERPSLAVVRMIDLNDAYKRGHSSALASREVAFSRIAEQCGRVLRGEYPSWTARDLAKDTLFVVENRAALAPFAKEKP